MNTELAFGHIEAETLSEHSDGDVRLQVDWRFKPGLQGEVLVSDPNLGLGTGGEISEEVREVREDV